MGKECHLIDKCGFFKKYSTTKGLVCTGFILTYCKGDKQIECKRLAYREQKGSPPSDDMMPNGDMIQV